MSNRLSTSFAQLSPVADVSGFQMVTVGEISPFQVRTLPACAALRRPLTNRAQKKSLDLKKAKQSTTLFLQEGDPDQAVDVFIVPPSEDRKRAGRIERVIITLKLSQLSRTRLHVERYAHFFATRFNLRHVRVIDNTPTAKGDDGDKKRARIH